jgi:valyl-tRNA synthetase
VYVGEDEDNVREKYSLAKNIKLIQDNDVLDTWFSSSLWPFTTLGWPEKTEELKKYYPTNVLVTGFDIIFFWVARMVMMGIKFIDKVPFKTIYIHGLVRDSEGKKMSKSLGNVIDPIDIIDGINLDVLIEKRISNLIQPKLKNKIINKTKDEFPDGIKPYGADALRFCFSALASTGRDISFDLKRIEGYRNFCNKLWNASRFVYISTEGHNYNDKIMFDNLSIYEKWIIIQLDNLVTDYKKYCTSYRFDLMASSLYSFIWNEYCDWYLEIAKIEINEGNKNTKNILIYTLQIILKLCHPIIPYITEEIWNEMRIMKYTEDDLLINAKFPSQQKIFKDVKVFESISILKDLVNVIRKTRSDLNVHPKIELDLYFVSDNTSSKTLVTNNAHIIKKLTKVNQLYWNNSTYDDRDCITITLRDLKAFIPIKNIIDIKQEINRLTKNLTNVTTNYKKVSQKLNNKDFIERAPSNIIQENLNKKNNLEQEIKSIKELLQYLSN